MQGKGSEQEHQKDVGVCEACGRPHGFADLPHDAAADREIWLRLQQKAMDPDRRKQFLEVFVKTLAGRRLFAALLFDLGLFQPVLPTTRAVALRDVAAHLLFSTGMSVNEVLVQFWFENLGTQVHQLNEQQRERLQRQQDAARTGFDADEASRAVGGDMDGNLF